MRWYNILHTCIRSNVDGLFITQCVFIHNITQIGVSSTPIAHTISNYWLKMYKPKAVVRHWMYARCTLQARCGGGGGGGQWAMTPPWFLCFLFFCLSAQRSVMHVDDVPLPWATEHSDWQWSWRGGGGVTPIVCEQCSALRSAAHDPYPIM